MKRRDTQSTQKRLEEAIQKALGKKATPKKSNDKTRYKTEVWDNGKGKKFRTRSSWEWNYAWYLEWLKDKGEIVEWQYEPDTFWFNAIKRGVRSYLPDFKIYNNNGTIEYHELKGYMDARSQTKIKRMAKYHPSIKLKVIGKESYEAIKKWGRVIPGWK